MDGLLKPVYRPLHHYLGRAGDKSFKGIDKVFREAVSLPIYAALKDAEVSKVIDVIKETLAGGKRCRS